MGKVGDGMNILDLTYAPVVWAAGHRLRGRRLLHDRADYLRWWHALRGIEVRVDVTMSDIESGMKGDCGRCPVALALARVVPPAVDGVRVDGHMATFDVGAAYMYVSLPASVSDFIRAFDKGRTVEPMRFGLSGSSALHLANWGMAV